MKLSIIGSGTCCWEYPGIACSCYLVSIDNKNILFDLGTGAILSSFSYNWKIDLRNIDAIFFSHIDHIDHIGDLPSLLFAMNFINRDEFFFPRNAPLLIYGPLGTEEMLFNIKRTFHFCNPMAMPLECHDIAPPESIALFDGITIHVKKAVHNVEALCMRIEHDNKAIAYSGDTAPCASLKSTIINADLAIIECSQSIKQKKLLNSHMTTSDVGIIASEANVKKLILTHRFNFYSEKQFLSEVKQHFKGDVELAKPGFEYSV